MKEAARFLGVETTAEVFDHSSKANAFFVRKLGKHGFIGVQLSPYKDGDWTISGMVPGESRFFFKSLDLEDWMDSPSLTAKTIVSSYGKAQK